MSEETKVCSKCGLEKPLNDFYFRRTRSTYRCECKECHNKNSRQYRITNNDKIKQYYNLNCQKLLEKNKQYRKQNREKLSEYDKHYRCENLEKRLEYEKHYRIINRKTLANRQKKYVIENKDKIKEHNNTPQRKISNRLRNRISDAIKEQYGNKAYRTMELLGCSIDECRKWLEIKFLPGMTWENYGKYGWHIDHIIPCASFDLTKPEEQLKCFHYTNLQPLWWEDNLSKSDKIQVLTSEGVFLV